MLDIPDTLTRIRHAYLADPGSPRIDAAMPHLDAALCVLLACDLREACDSAPAPQCPLCGTDIAPIMEPMGEKYRCRCGAACGNFTSWCASPQEARSVFYATGEAA